MSLKSFLWALALSSVLCLGCGDDDDTGTTDGGGGSDAGGGGGTDGGGGGTDGGGGGTDGGGGGTDGGGGDPDPTITRIEWAQEEGCTAGTASDTTITVTVEDGDNEPAELTYEGSVIGCTGEIDDAMVTLVCPQAAPYTGEVTVTDPDANSDTVEFMFGPCEEGMIEP